MKKKIFFITFILLWIFLVLLNAFLPKENFSEQENRVLAKMPTFSLEKLISGEYAEQLESYINDHFIFRNFWLKVKSTAELVTCKTENNGVYIGKEGYLFEKFSITEENEENLDKIAERINQFTIGKTIPISFILVPNSISIYEEYLPKLAPVSNQIQEIEKFYQRLKNIHTISVYETLIENKQKEQLYFKTDHHMTSDAAYLVYVEYCKSRKIDEEPRENFERVTVSNSFLGTFDSKAQVLNQEQDNIVIYQNQKNLELKEVKYDDSISNKIFNEEYLTKKDKYSYFLNGNHAKVVIKTKVENGKKILILKDSYAHNMAQFFCQNYEEIHLIDLRYYGNSISEYIQKEEINEILFLYNISNLVSDIGLRKLK